MQHTKEACAVLRNSKKERAIQVLRWTLFAQRPLTIGELAAALAIREGDKFLDTARLITDPRKAILNLCSPFIEIRQVLPGAFNQRYNYYAGLDGMEMPVECAYIVHFTVKEFFLRSATLGLPIVSSFILSDHAENHRQLVVAGLTYLSFPEFQ